MKQLIIATLGIFLFGCSSSLPERCETKAPSISSDTRKKNGQQWECNKDGGWKLIGQWKDGKCHSSCTSSKKAKVQNPKVQNRGYELACDGYPPQNSPHKLISIDCSNREIFIGTLRDSWLSLRRQGIGGTIENLCWEAYNDAKDLHPSISFLSVSESFLMRCNMGLAYLQD